MVDKEQDPVLWMRSKVEALKVLLDNPDFQSEQWMGQYLRCAEDLRDFWNSQYELVRPMTDDENITFSSCSDFYGGASPMLGTEEMKAAEDWPAIITGDHSGVSIFVSGPNDMTYNWDWRGKEHHPFIVSAVIEKILREKLTVGDIELIPRAFIKF